MLWNRSQYIFGYSGESINVPLDKVFILGRPSFKFIPASGSDLSSNYLSDHIVFTVSLNRESLQLIYPASLDKINLVVDARSTSHSAASGTMSHPAVVTTQPQEFSWLVDGDILGQSSV